MHFLLGQYNLVLPFRGYWNHDCFSSCICVLALLWFPFALFWQIFLSAQWSLVVHACIWGQCQIDDGRYCCSWTELVSKGLCCSELELWPGNFFHPLFLIPDVSICRSFCLGWSGLLDSPGARLGSCSSIVFLSRRQLFLLLLVFRMVCHHSPRASLSVLVCVAPYCQRVIPDRSEKGQPPSCVEKRGIWNLSDSCISSVSRNSSSAAYPELYGPINCAQCAFSNSWSISRLLKPWPFRFRNANSEAHCWSWAHWQPED